MYFDASIILLLSTLAAAGSPKGNYAPGAVNCPPVDSLVREADGISVNETEWLSVRQAVTGPNLASFLNSANLEDFDVDSFLSGKNISIALAFSGGGYRALYSGAGQLSAFDSNYGGDSPLKGILQASTYIAGLSGGAWLVGSLAFQDFNPVDSLLKINGFWESENSILSPDGLNVPGDISYYLDIGNDVSDKQNAHFQTTLTDLWGRAISYQLFNTFKHDGNSISYSDIAERSSFYEGNTPFPIIVADSKINGQVISNVEDTLFEFNPFEFGSWDPTLSKFTQLKYLGTKVDAGVPQSGCIAGYDNAGFVVGTSSSIFNSVLETIDKTWLPPVLKDLLDQFAGGENDYAYYDPNPFYDSSSSSDYQKSGPLNLVDGGEDGENVPLVPLLTPNRDVDIIFVNDNTNDIDKWPAGSSLISTYERQFTSQGADTPFPYVPDQHSFRNLNLTAKPTFFGCDAKNLSTLTSNIYDVPLVVYLANRPFSYWSNTSTEKLDYADWERNGMIDNGYAINSRKHGSLDSEWAACVGCAIIRRSQERNGEEQSSQCQRCFERYCWNGDIFEGEDIGENFSDDGLCVSAEYYNSKNVQGSGNGGASVFVALPAHNISPYNTSTLQINDTSSP